MFERLVIDSFIQLHHVLFCTNNRLIQTNVLIIVSINARIGQLASFITLKFVDGIIHKRAVKYIQTNQDLEVFNG